MVLCHRVVESGEMSITGEQRRRPSGHWQGDSSSDPVFCSFLLIAIVIFFLSGVMILDFPFSNLLPFFTPPPPSKLDNLSQLKKDETPTVHGDHGDPDRNPGSDCPAGVNSWCSSQRRGHLLCSPDFPVQFHPRHHQGQPLCLCVLASSVLLSLI